MGVNRFYFITLILLVSVLGYLTYQILSPFLSPIAWSVVFSIVFYPLYVLLLKYVRLKSVSSLITLGFILLLLIGPFSYVFYMLINEVKSVSEHIETGKIDTLVQNALKHPSIKNIVDSVLAALNISEAELNKTIAVNVSGLGKEFIGWVSIGVGNILAVLFNFIIMTFTTFFILKDGTSFLEKLRDYLPFSEVHKDRLATQTRDIIVSTIYGGVAVAIIQGIIGGTAFYFLGISSPVLLGIAISIASFVPLLGAFAVWGPVALYLFLTGTILQGVILAIIGTFGISMIDNVLKPIIIGSRTKVPVLAIFFSVLGGIKFFGLIGLIMGPLVLALFISVVKIFRNIDGTENVSA